MNGYQRKHDRHQPRSWMNMFLRFGGWAAFILGFLLFLLTFISVSMHFIADQLDRDGKITRATIVDSRIAVHTDVDGDQTHDYYVTLKFKTTQGGRTEEAEVTERFYNDHPRASEVLIRYLRDDPSVLEYEIGKYRRNALVLRWIALFFGVCGLFALWHFGTQANRAVIARRDGEKRFAEVTGIVDTSVEINEKQQSRLRWREEDGQQGESFMHDRLFLSQRYKLGDKIVVFRLGNDAYWEGDVGPPKREVE